MKKIILAYVLLLALACKRILTHSDVENELKTAMSDFLNKRVNYDTTVAKFEVVRVSNFFEDKAFYDCEFLVREKKAGVDTTGGMGAKISKDFSKVLRTY